MRLLQNYLAKTLLSTTLLVVMVFLGLEIFFSLVNELRFVGTGDYGILQAITYMLFTVPQKIYHMFPLSALLGSLIGLGLLAANSELIAMIASGISIRQLSFHLLKLALVLLIFVTFVGEVIAPAAQRMGTQHKAFSLSGGQTVQTAYGTWMRDGPNFIHIRKFKQGNVVEGMTRYQFDDQLRLKRSSYAAYGKYEKDHWTLFEVKDSVLDHDHVKTSYQKKTRWDSEVKPEVLEVVGVEHLERLPVLGLWRNIKYREANGLEVQELYLAFYSKLVQPFTTLVMIFLAVPFIFGPLRSVTMGVRIVTGILVGFGFHTLNSVFGPLALVYNFPAFLAAIFPTMLFAGFGLLLVRRVDL